MAMTLEALIARAEADGYRVAWRILSGCNGCYDHEAATIWLHTGLGSTPRRAISVLAHELAHAWRGDSGPQPWHIEQLCDEMAARLLINPAEYALAEAIYGPLHSILAIELGVTTRIIQAWQRHHTHALPTPHHERVGA